MQAASELEGGHMNEPMSTIASLAAIFLPPIISGPVAAIVFVAVLRREGRWRLPLFWASLLVVDFAAMMFMALTLGEFIGPGFFACLLMPVFAVGTLVVLVLVRKRAYRVVGEDEKRRTWYVVGALLIPFLQMAVTAALLVVGPLLCYLGIRPCSDW
jgi:hypothetical protein